jgi:hypothetical protein
LATIRPLAYNAPARIALEAGVMEQCEFHDEILFLGGAEIENAFKFGNSRFSAGALEGVFESRFLDS